MRESLAREVGEPLSFSALSGLKYHLEKLLACRRLDLPFFAASRLLFAFLQPVIARNIAVVFVDLAVPRFPLMKPRFPNGEPGSSRFIGNSVRSLQ
jgi:hypothetical protein